MNKSESNAGDGIYQADKRRDAGRLAYCVAWRASGRMKRKLIVN